MLAYPASSDLHMTTGKATQHAPLVRSWSRHCEGDTPGTSATVVCNDCVVCCAGKTLVPLEGDASISRVNETNLGNYICDAFLRSVPKAVAAKAGSTPIVCLMNAGGIRTGYKVRSGPGPTCAGLGSARTPKCIGLNACRACAEQIHILTGG